MSGLSLTFGADQTNGKSCIRCFRKHGTSLVGLLLLSCFLAVGPQWWWVVCRKHRTTLHQGHIGDQDSDRLPIWKIHNHVLEFLSDRPGTSFPDKPDPGMLRLMSGFERSQSQWHIFLDCKSRRKDWEDQQPASTKSSSLLRRAFSPSSFWNALTARFLSGCPFLCKSHSCQSHLLLSLLAEQLSVYLLTRQREGQFRAGHCKSASARLYAPLPLFSGLLGCLSEENSVTWKIKLWSEVFLTSLAAKFLPIFEKFQIGPLARHWNVTEESGGSMLLK